MPKKFAKKKTKTLKTRKTRVKRTGIKKPLIKKKPSSKTPRKTRSKKSVPETNEQKIERLLKKGKARSFITHGELLVIFPKIEEDIVFLDHLYTRLEENGINIIESTDILETDKDDKDDLYGSLTPSSDSVQMYLKEIGRMPLITASPLQ